MPPGYSLLVTQRTGGSGYREVWPTAWMMKNLYIPPPDTFSHAQTYGFREGFLGSEVQCEARDRFCTVKAESNLLGGEYPVYESISPFIDYSSHPRYIYEIYADAINHSMLKPW